MTSICKCFYKLFKAIFYLLVIVALLPLVPNLPPDFKFTSFTLPDPPALEGKLALNSLLNGAERILEGQILGPESFLILNGELYTSLHGGFVGKLVGDEIRPVIKFGESCAGILEEAKCGRPLGLAEGPDGLLYVADAYYGIFTLNTITNEKNRLVGSKTEINGKKPKIFNSIVVTSDGTVYYTDSSTDVSLQDGFFSLLADGTGRLIKYDPKTKKNTVLIDNILFANGVGVASDESFLIVSETGMSRIRRYWLKGPKAGKSDIFADNLPGLPDNIQSGTNGFLVSLVAPRDNNNPVLTQSISPFPYLRKAISRALRLFELGFSKINEFYPNVLCDSAVHFIGHFSSTTSLVGPRVTLLVFDVQGKVLDSFHATDRSVTSISDAIIYRGQLFLGSPYNNYLGRIKKPETVARLEKVFPTPSKITIRQKEATIAQKQSTTTPKTTSTTTTTTTTQKPVTTTTQKATTTPKPTTTTTPRPTTTTTSRPTTTTTPRPTTTTTPRPSTTTTPKPTTTTTSTPKTVTTTTTPKPITTTTEKPITSTTAKPISTTQQPTTTTPKPATTQKPLSASQKPETSSKPHATTQQPKVAPTKETPSKPKPSDSRNEL